MSHVFFLLLVGLLLGEKLETLPDDAPEIILYLESHRVEVGVPIYAAVLIRKETGKAPTMVRPTVAMSALVFARRLDRPDEEPIRCLNLNLTGLPYSPEVWLYSFREFHEFRRIWTKEASSNEIISEEAGTLEIWAETSIIRSPDTYYVIRSRPIRIEVVEAADDARMRTAAALRDSHQKRPPDVARILEDIDFDLDGPAGRAANYERGLAMLRQVYGLPKEATSEQRSALLDESLRHLLGVGEDLVLRCKVLEHLISILKMDHEAETSGIRAFVDKTVELSEGTTLERIACKLSEECRGRLGDG